MRFESAVNQNKQASQLFPANHIALDKALQGLHSRLPAFGVAISGKIHQMPGLVDEEMVDEHGLSWGGRGHGEPFSPGQHIDETGFSGIAAAKKSDVDSIGRGSIIE